MLYWNEVNKMTIITCEKEEYVGSVEVNGVFKGWICPNISLEQLKPHIGKFVKFSIILEPLEIYKSVVTKQGLKKGDRIG